MLLGVVQYIIPTNIVPGVVLGAVTGPIPALLELIS